MLIDPTQNELAIIRERLNALFTGQGAGLYGGEYITQLEHALQTALMAEEAGEPAPMILAALLHDVGHFFESDFDEALSSRTDARHERIGAKYLSRWFGPEVAEPVRLHVEAKRYLCSVSPAYLTTLSEASIHSLALQGGPMGRQEIESFVARPFAAQAVRLRQYDDRAKIVDRATPPLDHFLGLIR
jgi:phosphonate degradation associated HDIG domain protein